MSHITDNDQIDFLAQLNAYSLLMCYTLSHNSTVFQWIMSCHKKCMTTHAITFWCMQCAYNVTDNICVNNVFSYSNNVHFEGNKMPF